MFSLPFFKKYSHIAESDDTETFLSNSEKLELSPYISNRKLSPYVITISWLLASLATLAFGFCIGQSFPRNLDATCTRHTSKYSPILDDSIVSYELVEFDGRFTSENVFRKGAGPEVDAAWESLGVGYGPILLPDELASKAGLNKNHAHRNPELGGGYPVFMEGMHQLHCLNLVRKSLYYNYEHYLAQGAGAFGDSSSVLRWHVSHCLDIVRQRLMCTTDIGVFGSVWVNRTDPHPFVDFNTKHVCKNFDAIRGWAERHQMPEDLPMDFWEMPGEDVHVWDTAP